MIKQPSHRRKRGLNSGCLLNEISVPVLRLNDKRERLLCLEICGDLFKRERRKIKEYHQHNKSNQKRHKTDSNWLRGSSKIIKTMVLWIFWKMKVIICCWWFLINQWRSSRTRREEFYWHQNEMIPFLDCDVANKKITISANLRFLTMENISLKHETGLGFQTSELNDWCFSFKRHNLILNLEIWVLSYKEVWRDSNFSCLFGIHQHKRSSDNQRS